MNDYFDNLDVTEKNLKYLVENHKDIYEAYESFGKLIHETGGPLDKKTCWLIKIAVSVSSQYENALVTHILKALESGCTKEEIEHTILLVAPTSGFPKMMKGLLILRDTLELDK
ncbi:carboxymuconolactone decarboxylase family protein [Clostridium sp.]|uniref:carboxymuconolactone decarboxylase family protein n=1 Tax=Clostridium sp. TaxID=1506 RepID=UPI00262B7048|nr:carboxymuconolactone decarboxylase family protein [Clostridium sp.]